ncbi:hypothetical protein QBC43DRAFT_289671 [Cladorrhinum sp. PSN259]|nr:hypothetical protein QBC43DRAFT_289671 [Cladorrhinum sp. PSN259]
MTRRRLGDILRDIEDGISEDELLKDIENCDDIMPQEMPAESSEDGKASLDQLYIATHEALEASMAQIKGSLQNKNGRLSSELLTSIFLRLHNGLRALRYWADDVAVTSPRARDSERNEIGLEAKQPLVLVEHYAAEIPGLVERLRFCLTEIKQVAAAHMTGLALDAEPPPDVAREAADRKLNELERSVKILQDFALPLRDFLEARESIGRKAAIQDAVASIERELATKIYATTQPSVLGKDKNSPLVTGQWPDEPVTVGSIPLVALKPGPPAPTSSNTATTERRRSIDEYNYADSTSSSDYSLADRIMDAEVQSEFDMGSPTFLPEGCLDTLITKHAILHQLLDGNYDRNASTELQELAIFIESKARKVFAILVGYMGWEGDTLVGAMQAFINHDFTDKELPVPRPDKHHRSHILDSLNPRKGRPIWRASSIDHFFTVQWRVLVPVFQLVTDRHIYDFSPHHILPFIRRYDSDAQRGGFGSVHKYQVHPNHVSNQLKPEERWEFVAVKEVTSMDNDNHEILKNWKQEAAVLQHLNTLQHDHIIRFIAAFRRGEAGRQDHYLMFDWADGGNLRDLWKAMPDPILTPVLLKAATKQILGLADAISKIHYPLPGTHTIIRHGDLKPENILWFKGIDQLGTLKIGDWGLAKAHRIGTQRRLVRTTEIQYGTRRYEPPEVELDSTSGSGKPMSRLYDIWGMGCIMLELVTWLLYGIDGLIELNKEFHDHSGGLDHAFYQIEMKEHVKVAKIHDVVVKWMDRMGQEPCCEAGTTALGDILDLIRTRLLIVKLPITLGTLPDLEQPPDSTRPSLRFTGPDNEPLPGSIEISEIVVEDTTNWAPISSKVDVGRARADEFLRRMEEIYNNDQEGYWHAIGQTGKRMVPRLHEAQIVSSSKDRASTLDMVPPGHKRDDGAPPIEQDETTTGLNTAMNTALGKLKSWSGGRLGDIKPAVSGLRHSPTDIEPAPILQDSEPPAVPMGDGPLPTGEDERGGILDELRRGISSTTRRRLRDMDIKMSGLQRFS